MQFNKKSTIVILKMFTSTVALFLLASGAALAAPASGAINWAHAVTSAPQTADAACSAILPALEKNFTIPYHLYMTMTSGAVQNGKPRNSETIFVGGMNYVLVNGKWITTPVSADDKKLTEETIRKNTKTGTCHYVRDESVNGENTAVFATHNQTENGTSDNQIWISKSKGLIVKQESDIDVGGGRPKSHIAMRYEYTNVQAPKM